MLERYLNHITRWHKPTVFISVLVVLILAAGVTRIQLTNDFRIYFGKDNPQLSAFEQLEETFGRQDLVYFFLQPKSKDVFDRQVLSLVWELTEQSWDLPYVDRVNSLSNYQHTEAKDDELATDYLINDPNLLTDEAIQRIRQIVLNEPVLINNMIPPDGSVTGVGVRLRLPVSRNQAADEVVIAARKLMREFQQRYPDVDISLGGNTSAGVTLGEAVNQDLKTLVSLSYLIIVIGLMVLLRSLKGMLVTILLVTFATLATMGTYGWLGFVLTPVAGWVPSVVMTIAVADSVHILISYFHGLRNGVGKKEAIRESMRINANPVLVTSLTTMIGVLCLNFSDSPPYQDLGNMVALGVFYAYLLSMTFLPAMLSWLTVGRSHMNRGPSKGMDIFSAWVMQNHRALLVSMGLLLVVLISFIGRNELTERWHEYFDESFETRQTIESINEKLTGVHYIRYLIKTGKPGGIHDPAYLDMLEAFANWYRQQPGVAYVTSLVDISKRLNKTLHNDQQDWYRVPGSSELAAQLFLLYELGLPRELNLDNLVNLERSASLVTVSVHKTDSEFLLDLDQRAQGWLAQHAADYFTSEGTGLDMVFAHINHRNISSLLLGAGLGLVLISFVLMVALRSVKLGLLSLIPNLAPAAMAYGAWGLFIGRVDLSASVVICMSMGIVVDDTVHFLSKYLRARREYGYDIVQGMQYAFHTVGVALSITTVVLVSGFLVLVASHFSPTWVSGLLMAITLSFALLADFFFLPPLLMALDSRPHLLSNIVNDEAG